MSINDNNIYNLIHSRATGLVEGPTIIRVVTTHQAQLLDC